MYRLYTKCDFCGTRKVDEVKSPEKEGTILDQRCKCGMLGMTKVTRWETDG